MIKQSSAVSLRSVTANDWEYILAVENDPRIWQYSTLSEAPYSAADIIEFCSLCELTSPRSESVEQLRFIITIDHPTPIGIIDLYDIDQDAKTAYTALIIHPFEHHGKGYAKAAMKELCRYSKDKLLLTTLMAEVGSDNTKSRSLFLNCGFSFESNFEGVETYRVEL